MEPERPIEKLLRACAKKRRDEAGAPLELHPATRRLLQGEVARRFARPKSQPGGFPALFGRFWPGFALATLTLMAVASALLLPSLTRRTPESLMARNDRFTIAPPANAPAPQPAAPAAEMEKQKDQPAVALDDLNRTAPVKRDEAALSLNGTVSANKKENPLSLSGAVPPGTSAAAVPDLNNEMSKQLTPPAAQPGLTYKSPNAGGLAGQPVQPPSADRAEIGSLAQAPKAAEGSPVQRFVQTLPTMKAKATLQDKISPSGILTAFQFERSGQTVRIVDSDGSVYTGYVQLAGLESRARSVRREQERAPEVAAAPGRKLESFGTGLAETGTNFFSFSVAGTNRSSNLNIVFTATLLPANAVTVPTPGTNHSFEGIGGRSGLPPAPPNPAPMDSRIQGKVFVGGRPGVDVNATLEK